jgi:hypothetical protein
MNAMIYAIFICMPVNSTQAYCTASGSLQYASAQDCKTQIAAMYTQNPGGGTLRDGRIYTTGGAWIECQGKPTWAPVQ